jgi:membrane glycosyltransferase
VRAALSVLTETLIGGLVAPIAMLIQTSGVLSILSGHDSGWNTQRRDDGGIPLMDIVRQYGRFTLFGLALGAGAWVVSPSLFFWMTPVLLGLVFSIPLVALTSSRAVGLDFRRAGLLLVPEETAPPPVLNLLAAAESSIEAKAKTAPALPGDSLKALRADARLARAHLAMLPPPRKAGEAINPDQLVGLVKLGEAGTLTNALRVLSPREKAAVLGTAPGVEIILHLPD